MLWFCLGFFKFMADLTNIEKLKLEKLFEMGDGYVLDFTNREFREFIQNAVNKDIYNDKYAYESGSKANRLRAFLETENNKTVATLLVELLEYWKTVRLLNDKEISSSEKTLLDNCKNIAKRLNPELETTDIPALITSTDDCYVNKERLEELKKLKNKKHDLTKLTKLLEELNNAYKAEMYFSVMLLLRAIIDHVPPIFGKNNFNEVTNQYGTRSFKELMIRLEKSSRKISDSFLHTPIREKEVLPNKSQVNYTNDIDVLLAEIVRILK